MSLKTSSYLSRLAAIAYEVKQHGDAPLWRKRCVVLLVGPVGVRETVEDLQHLVHVEEIVPRALSQVLADAVMIALQKRESAFIRDTAIVSF